MIFELAQDFHDVVAVIPNEHSKHRMLELLEEAIRRNIHFIARHPTTLFQCMWNTCWWYDSPEAAKHYEEPEDEWHESPPWCQRGPKAYLLLDTWRCEKDEHTPKFYWLRCLRPPDLNLGTSQHLVLRGHVSSVYSVAYSPDNRWIATGSGDATVRIWDSVTGEEKICFRGHRSQVLTVAYSPDGRHVVSGSGFFLPLPNKRDNTIRMWDTNTGVMKRCIRGHKGSVTCVSYSPNGNYILSSSNDGTVRTWDARSGRAALVLHGHMMAYCAAYSPDGRYIVSGGGIYGRVNVWDALSGTRKFCLSGHERQVACVACSPDSCWVVSSSYDNTIRVWNIHTGAEFARLSFNFTVHSVAFSPDGKYVAGTTSNAVWRWDFLEARNKTTLRHLGQCLSAVRNVSFSPDGQEIAGASMDGTVRTWRLGTGHHDQIRRVRGHAGSISALACSPDGGTIISGSWGDLRIWNTETGEQIGLLQTTEDDIDSIAYSPDGRLFACVGGMEDKVVHVWDANTYDEYLSLDGHESRLTAVAFSPDGQNILSSSRDGKMCVWDAESGVQLRCLQGQGGEVTSIAYWPDGLEILYGSKDCIVRKCDAQTGEVLQCLRGHKASVAHISITPDGRQIVSRATDGETRVWNSASGRCLKIIHNQWDVHAIAAGPLKFPYRVTTDRQETIVKEASTGQSIVTFGKSLYGILTLTNQRMWTGHEAHHLYIIRLEVGTGT